MEREQESQLVGAESAPVRSTLTRMGGRWAVLAIGSGVAMRLWMLHTLFVVNGDSLVYGGIAKNILLHSRYALTTATGITYGTLIRLPGYPLFLALCFRLFGVENYFAVGCVQIVVELAGCVLLAAFAGQMAQQVRQGDAAFARRTGLATLWLAALCPFTASYAGRSMAEPLTLFVLALAMYSMGQFSERPNWGSALAFTFAVTYATLLRPDGALAVVAFVPVVLARLKRPSVKRTRMALVCMVLALAPFGVWTWRNMKVFHVFQPLAPRSATDPDERLNPGFERWIKSWCLGFPCTENVYWNVPDDTLDVSLLPDLAFDSPAQFDETIALARDYNARGKKLTPDIDARFGQLANQRIAKHPLRYYVLLPVGRMAAMWLRPRNENLPAALEWWNFKLHRGETLFAWVYIALNAAYLLLAILGLRLRPRFWKALLAYLLLRSALLLTVQAPEARYTLECFPMIFALGGLALAVYFEPVSAPSSARPIQQQA